MSGQKICLITGSSQGIGAATALEAARCGFDVCINYVHAKSEKKAKCLVKEIKKEGMRAIAVRADVGNARQVRRLFGVIDKKLGRITALVNNAGIPGERKAFLDFTEAEFDRVLQVNLMGTIHCTRQALLRMAKSCGGRGGVIVNMSSSVTITGGRNLSAYTTTKEGIEGFTLSTAKDYAIEGVRVNMVRPGIIATNQLPLHEKKWKKRMEASIPLRRLGEPSEVAKPIMFLLSDHSSYMTGAVLDINGGR